MRRLALLALAVLLAVFSGTASGAERPTPRTIVRNALAPVRPAAQLPAVERRGNRTRVILSLSSPPLAAATYVQRLGPSGAARKVNLATPFAHSYLSRLEAEQAQAIATVKRAIPSAVVSRRYEVVLNGFAVSLPYASLPKLLDLGVAEHVYPSLTYHRSLNVGPSVIGAPQFSAATGAKGDGVKVAVVDDGVDSEHPFLSPAGLSYPAGFPKGPGGGTTPKVIVARGFAGPGASSAPLDREQSFHGTFVAGVIAGVPTNVPAGKPGFCSESNGGCHPAVNGVSGVAPRAYIGNYRVFNQPDPFGGCCSGNSPEIVAAFEAAVRDGMDIVNFSGGGPQTDPRTDALIPAVANVAKAGVVPIISAGNDRDFFGLGTAGSPATAPDAIAVGATTNAHVFGASLQVTSPAGLPRMPFVPTDTVPASWTSRDQKLVDVGSLGVDRTLCADRPALPSGSLNGAIALVSRGGCSYFAKSARAAQAGAEGIVIAENREGDPSYPYIPGLNGGAVSDVDGQKLRSAAAGAGGSVTVRFNRDVLEVPTSWAGVPSSYSAGGLTPFGHALKPDVTAPGSQVLSSTLPEFAGDDYAVLDGTSFSAPHVSGAAALLVQRHPTWTAGQVKSALMSTAGPAWGDSARTQEASVLVQGAGLVNVGAADRPLIFTAPQSLSFGYLSANTGANSKSISISVSDAGGGDGTWTADVQPQVASPGATVEAAPVTLGPGGSTVLQVTARAAAGATAGDDFGFVVLRRGSDTRRIPYAFSVTRSSLGGAPVIPLKTLQSGDTRVGEDRAHVYRWPTSPFSILGIFGVDPTVNDDGKEKVYALDLPKQAVNAGVVVVRPEPKLDANIIALLSSNQPIHPWFLGSLDENDTLGYAAIPVNVNGLLPDFLFSIGASGGVFLPAGRYYVSVDSGRDLFTGRSLAGPYVLRSWVNDVKPPTVRLLTQAISSGRPTLAVKVTDAKSGVDPFSLQLFFGPPKRIQQVGATTWDSKTGVATFAIPRESPPLEAGTQFMRVMAADYQESKNVDTEGPNPMPNTKFLGIRIQARDRPVVSWITPDAPGRCAAKSQRLQVIANDSVAISSVGFFDGNRQIGRVRRSQGGVYSLTWTGRRKGVHKLTATASDVRGRESSASTTMRVCG